MKTPLIESMFLTFDSFKGVLFLDMGFLRPAPHYLIMYAATISPMYAVWASLFAL